MENLKAIAGLVVLFSAGSFVSTCSNHMRMADARADQAEDAQNLEGFAGYAYGSGDLYIMEQMKAEGYEPIRINETAVWYEGEILGYAVEFGYVFEDGLLIGGGWIFEDHTDQAFQEIEDHLQDVYGGDISIEIDGDLLIGTFLGPDSLIIHSLRPYAHEVMYTQVGI